MSAKSSLICVLLLSGIAYSCKKPEDKKEEQNNNIIVSPITADVSGAMQANYYYTDGNNNVTADSSLAIAFYQSPANMSLYVDAGPVSVNSQSLTYTTYAGYQNFGPAFNLHSTLNVAVSGSPSSTVAPFTYAFQPNMPKYSGGGALPDTCVKSGGVSLSISGMSNFGSCVVMLAQDSQSKYKVLTSNGTAAFSAQELSAFTAGGPASIMVSASNISKVKIGNVNYNLISSLSYNKLIYLK